ncbi:MAG TPA: T9SS type A sorting domain-containing protein [Bacteroidales bacterium]|nr:T9SS type A sorting domain-containing protein [Bacteroidales bacterium]
MIRPDDKVIVNENNIPENSLKAFKRNNVLYIEGITDHADLSIFDAAGKLILKKRVSGNEDQVYTGNLAKGLYTVYISINGEQEYKCFKFIR